MLKRIPVHGVALLVLIFLLFSAYSNTFFNSPVMDDFHSFVDQPNLQLTSFDLASLHRLTETEFGVRRVIPMATFAWDFYWGHGHIWAFHITNFMIHLQCMFALFFFLKQLVQCVDWQNFHDDSLLQPNFWFVLTVVGVWSLSPVQTNAVTYLVQRMTSLATLFFVLSLAFYLKARFGQRRRERWGLIGLWYLLCLLSAIGAFLSKENSATLPVVVVVLEVMFLSPGALQRFFRKKKICWAVAALMLAAALVFAICVLPGAIKGYEYRHFTLGERLLTELRVVSSYIFLLLCPLPKFMNFEYDVTLSTSLFAPPVTMSSLLFIVSLLYFAWKMRGRYKLISFGVFWFFTNLLIESTVIPLELKFEHRLYLPSIGFYLALVSLIQVALGKWLFVKSVNLSRKPLIISFCFIIFALLSSMTYMRNICWASNLSLYTDCVKKAPGKARNHVNLARAYAVEGNYDKTIEEAEKAISVGKDGYEEYWGAACNIVSSCIAKGDLEQAIQRGEAFLKGNIPKHAKQNSYPLFLHNLGLAYMRSGDYQNAYNCSLGVFDFMLSCKGCRGPSNWENELVMLLTKVYESKDGFAAKVGLDLDDKSTIYRVVANLFYERARFDKALLFCKKGARINPNAKWCGALRQDIEQSVRCNTIQKQKGTLRDKYLLHPFKDGFHLYMALAYLQLKTDFLRNGALSCLSRAQRLKPGCPDVRLLKSWLLFKEKKYSVALDEIDSAIELDPNYAHLWVNKAVYAFAAGRYQDAIMAADKVLTLYPGYPFRKKIESIRISAMAGNHESTNKQ